MLAMCSEEKCLKCNGNKKVYGGRWCDTCWYPGIDEDWNEYQSLIDEGYRRADAAVRSGWLSAEEI
jgi:DnaJ-class molecular chaperone